MPIAKPIAVMIVLTVMLLCRTTGASSQPEVGHISCDVVLDYVGTSPPYYALLRSFLEGYLAGGKGASPLELDNRDATHLLSKAIDYCQGRRDADFASAIAAAVKNGPEGGSSR